MSSVQILAIIAIFISIAGVPLLTFVKGIRRKGSHDDENTKPTQTGGRVTA